MDSDKFFQEELARGMLLVIQSFSQELWSRFMSPTGSVNTICGPGPPGHLGWHQNLCWEPGMLLLSSGAGLGVAELEQEEGTGTGNSLVSIRGMEKRAQGMIVALGGV